MIDKTEKVHQTPLTEMKNRLVQFVRMEESAIHKKVNFAEKTKEAVE